MNFHPKKPNYSDCSQCEARGDSGFSVLNSVELALFSSLKTCNHYGSRQVVFYEGNAPLALYCIQKGTVKLHRSAVDGRQQILHLAQPGELLGYSALLAGQTYPFTAETVDECDICVIDKTAFLRVLEKSPRLVRHLLENTCAELNAASVSTCNLAQKSVRERIAEALLLLAQSHGVREKKGVRLDISLSRQELADLAGTVLETGIRFLSEFREERLIEIKGRHITILDVDALMKVSGVER